MAEQSSTDPTAGTTPQGTPTTEPLPCPAHPEMYAGLFCETCEVLICDRCTLTAPHRDHQYGKVADVFPKHRDELEACVKPMYEQLDACNQAIADLKAQRDALACQQETITREVNESARKIHEALDARRDALFAHVDQVTEEKKRNMAVQRQQLLKVYHRLKAYHDFVQNSLETGSDIEILAMSKPICDQASEIQAALTSRPEILEPCERADQEFQAVGFDELEEQFRNFGKVIEYVPVICLDNCRAEGPGLEVAVAGEKTEVIVQVIDQEGRIYQRPVDVTFELVSSDRSCKLANGEGKRTKETGFVVTYCSPHRGKFRLHIRVDGVDIPGSPFAIQSIMVIPGLCEPWGVAYCERNMGGGEGGKDEGGGGGGGDRSEDGEREVIVSESGAHCISVFNRDSGEKLRSFGCKGNGPRQFNTPCGVAITPTGDILVCDSNNHRILLLSSEGTPLKAVGSKGKKSLQFNEPVGIAVHPHSEKIYVTEFRNNRVQILNRDFTFSSKFGHSGSNPGEFNRPYGIAIDSTGNVYVAERYNHRIQVFTEIGGYLRQFEPTEKLVEPTGLAIDAEDNVYVCNTGSHQVSVFKPDGQYVRSLRSGCGQGVGQCRSPFDITVDRNHVAYITDGGNSRVLII